MPSTQSSDEFNVDVEEKVEEFKLTFIEQMKSNLREVLKDEIRQIIKGCVRYIFASLFCISKGEHF